MTINFFLVFVTIRSKSLKGSANKLLAIYSFCELFDQSGYLLLFFTSIDRLFHVLFPIITRQKMYTRFMFCVSLPLSTIYAAMFLYNFICQNFDEELIIGTISDLALAFYRCNGGAAGRLFFARNVILSSTVTVYGLLAIRVYFRKDTASNAEKANLRIFRSLFVIIFVNIGGYFAMSMYITRTFQEDSHLSMELWTWNQILAILLNLSATSNALILCFMSSEYRKAFQKELKVIGKTVTKCC